jgi:hypothetical protein
MGKQVTEKKRKFAKAYAESGSVREACDAAGYTSHQAGYRFIKRDKSGQLVDPVMRSLLAEYGAPGVEPLPEPVQLPARIERKRNLAAEVVKLEVVPRGGDISISRVRELLLYLAEDDNTPAGPRVQALNILLKDLRDEQVPDVPDDDDILSAIQEKLSVSNG